MKKNVILIIVIVFTLLLLKTFLTYRPPISGIVTNSVSGEPIPDMQVDRLVEFIVPSPGGSSTYKVEKYSTHTNNDGIFTFSPKLIWKPPFPFVVFGEEWVNINANFGDDTIDSINKKYNMVGFSNGKGGVIRRPEENKRYYEIIISPVVDNLDECQDNPLCIEENSFAYALKTKNESLCYNVDKSLGTKFQRGVCLSIVGVAKNSESICTLDGYYGYLCVKHLKESNKQGICSLFMTENHRRICLEILK